MKYPLLKERDHLPAAGVMQKLLNRAGAEIPVDGLFGPVTLAALLKFQEERGLPPSGITDEATWAALAAGLDLPVVDAIDFWEPDLYAMDAAGLRRNLERLMPGAAACGSVEEAADALCAAHRNVFLLRVHGLNAAGPHPAVLPERIFRGTCRLRGLFGPYGCIHFLNCRTGRGAEGRRTIARIAEELGVPVSAGLHDQLTPRLEARRFEGWTATVTPHRQSLAEWCSSRPDFPEPPTGTEEPIADVSVC